MPHRGAVDSLSPHCEHLTLLQSLASGQSREKWPTVQLLAQVMAERDSGRTFLTVATSDVVGILGFFTFLRYVPLLVTVAANLLSWLGAVLGDMVFIAAVVAGTTATTTTSIGIWTVFGHVTD